MNPRDEKEQALKGNLESPYLEAELFKGEPEAEWEASLAMLETASPFRLAFEQEQSPLIEPEEEEEESFQEEREDEEEYQWEDTEAFNEEALEQPEAIDEKIYDQEDLYTKEKEAFYEYATSLDEEPLISSEDSIEEEEEESLDEESFIESEEEEAASATYEAAGQSPTIPADIADFALSLGKKWANRRNGSPPAEKITEWLLQDYLEASSPTPQLSKPPSELVRFAQRVLNSTESEHLKDDGNLGPLTRAALERFHKKYNLSVNGVLDDNTQLALAQRALEEIKQQSLSGQYGVLDAAIRDALITFKSEHGLGYDATLDTATRTALTDALEKRTSTPNAPTPVMDSTRNWAEVEPDQRMLYVMKLLVDKYRYPVNGAAGIVGNLWAESGVIPNRVEGSKPATPMRALNYNKVMKDFSPEEIMNRNSKQGPLRPGIGLAQWTSKDRRKNLFQHTFLGTRMGVSILNNMDAQVDYLVTELKTLYKYVDKVLRKANVSLEEASDEIIYNFEVPGSILSKPGADGRRRKLPRNEPAVQDVFIRRRRYSSAARKVYRNVHPEV